MRLLDNANVSLVTMATTVLINVQCRFMARIVWKSANVPTETVTMLQANVKRVMQDSQDRNVIKNVRRANGVLVA